MIKRYHYVYRITHIVKKLHYYGTRTTSNTKETLPENDLGSKYFSSSKNKDFIQEQILNPDKFKYKIVKIFDSRIKALALEIKLHNKFNVKIHNSFYNRANQTSTGFDTTGTISLKKGIFDKNCKTRRLIFAKNDIPIINKHISSNYNIKINKFYLRSPEIREKYSKLRKEEYIKNPELRNRVCKLSRGYKLKIAQIRQKKFIKDGELTTSYKEGSRRGVETRKKSFLMFEGQLLTIEQISSIKAQRTNSQMLIYNGIKMTKSKMISLKAAETMKSTFKMFEGRLLSINQIRSIKTERTRSRNKRIKNSLK